MCRVHYSTQRHSNLHHRSAQHYSICTFILTLCALIMTYIYPCCSASRDMCIPVHIRHTKWPPISNCVLERCLNLVLRLSLETGLLSQFLSCCCFLHEETMDTKPISTGNAGNIASTLPSTIYPMVVLVGALLLVWAIGVILASSYMLKDLRVVRPARGRTQSQPRGGSAPR